MHALICGVTLTGKTTLARVIARDVEKAGGRVIVYDPVGTQTGGGGWPASAVIFDDPDEFIEYMNHPDVYDAHVFVDEADEVFSLSDRANYWLPKKGRHFGFTL
jgi:DNA helicase HerA-like ATPase